MQSLDFKKVSTNQLDWIASDFFIYDDIKKGDILSDDFFAYKSFLNKRRESPLLAPIRNAFDYPVIGVYNLELGKYHSSNFDFASAEKFFSEAETMFENLDEADYRKRDLVYERTFNYFFLGQVDKARKSAENLLKLNENIYGTNHPSYFRTLGALIASAANSDSEKESCDSLMKIYENCVKKYPDLKN